jgi:hypothetical protein
VVAVLGFNKTCTVQVDGQPAPVVIGDEVAQLIWVIPENELDDVL